MANTNPQAEQLAELLFPAVTETPAQILQRYAPRELAEGAIVTRFAPSPTGFIHIGSIYIALLGRTLAQQSGGIFILRVEDTDQQRKLEGGVEEIVGSLLEFGIQPDEGPYALDPLAERGDYGPYQQSERKAIYAAFARQLVAAGLAYPSFQTPEQLAAIRAEQERAKARPGYYGPWATDRDLSLDEVRARLGEGQRFVIRYKATYPNQEKIVVDDAIRGRLELPANDQDMVLLKSDGLPTYHLAHAVDDAAMRVNLILRADEWLATLPLHVQLFEGLGLPVPRYAHIAPIGKQDGSSKRKLSKRKDPEAAVGYYYREGYPRQAILEYLLNLMDSSFEAWRLANPGLPFSDFTLRLDNMSPSIALFDLNKLDSIAKEIIAAYSETQIYQEALAWARTYSPELAPILEADPDYAQRVFGVERGGESPRKDLAHWSQIYPAYGFFFDELYQRTVEGGYAMPAVAAEDIGKILAHVAETAGALPDKDAWLQGMRDFSAAIGFAPNAKVFKQSPGEYRGHFADVMGVVRVALTGQTRSPDMYEMLQIMGPERVARRLAQAAEAAGK